MLKGASAAPLKDPVQKKDQRVTPVKQLMEKMQQSSGKKGELTPKQIEVKTVSETKRPISELKKTQPDLIKKDNWMTASPDQNDIGKGTSFLPPINSHKPSFIIPNATLSHSQIALNKVEILDGGAGGQGTIDNEGPQLQLITVEDANELDNLESAV
jgi:hypothetical protein